MVTKTGLTALNSIEKSKCKTILGINIHQKEICLLLAIS